MIKDEDILKTAFRTPYGYYEFLVTSFGLKISPTVYMDLINHIFRTYYDSFEIVLFYDILVYLRSREDNTQQLRITLETLRDNMLFCQISVSFGLVQWHCFKMRYPRMGLW